MYVFPIQIRGVLPPPNACTYLGRRPLELGKLLLCLSQLKHTHQPILQVIALEIEHQGGLKLVDGLVKTLPIQRGVPNRCAHMPPCIV
jgi:hypothetical protein